MLRTARKSAEALIHLVQNASGPIIYIFVKRPARCSKVYIPHTLLADVEDSTVQIRLLFARAMNVQGQYRASSYSCRPTPGKSCFVIGPPPWTAQVNTSSWSLASADGCRAAVVGQ